MIVHDINTEILEGRLLLAALAIITTESRTDKTPDQVMKAIEVLADQMDFKNK